MRHFSSRVILTEMGDYTVPCVYTQLWLRVFGGLNVNNVASQPHLHLSNQLHPEEHGQAETSLYTAQADSPLKSGST